MPECLHEWGRCKSRRDETAPHVCGRQENHHTDHHCGWCGEMKKWGSVEPVDQEER